MKIKIKEKKPKNPTVEPMRRRNGAGKHSDPRRVRENDEKKLKED